MYVEYECRGRSFVNNGCIGVVYKAVLNDWVVVCSFTTPVGRAFEPGGRNIISGFERLDTKADPGLLRFVRLVQVLGIFGGAFSTK